MAKTDTIPDTSFDAPTVRSWNIDRLSILAETRITGLLSSLAISSEGVAKTDTPPTTSHHPLRKHVSEFTAAHINRSKSIALRG